MNLLIENEITPLEAEIDFLNKILESFAKEETGRLRTLLTSVLVNSGKRVRPTLAYLGAGFGSPDPHQVRLLALVVELIHTGTLIHDDVVDKAVLRRGQRTISDEHGVEMAVLLGDHVFAFAFQQLARLGHPGILEFLSRTTSAICKGEIDQLENRFRFDLPEEAYYSFISRKTASLFGASVRSGAMLADQPLDVQVALESYGVHLGMAFQITDDLLDLTGEESVVGKTLRTDLLNGKMTLPMIHYRNQVGSSFEWSHLKNRLDGPHDYWMELVEKMKVAGSMAYAETVAAEHVTKALLYADEIPPGAARTRLIQFAGTVIKRKR